MEIILAFLFSGRYGNGYPESPDMWGFRVRYTQTPGFYRGHGRSGVVGSNLSNGLRLLSEYITAIRVDNSPSH